MTSLLSMDNKPFKIGVACWKKGIHQKILFHVLTEVMGHWSDRHFGPHSEAPFELVDADRFKEGELDGIIYRVDGKQQEDIEYGKGVLTSKKTPFVVILVGPVPKQKDIASLYSNFFETLPGEFVVIGEVVETFNWFYEMFVVCSNVKPAKR
mmetsp:Transcript_9455/g.12735  ORF Transcript_9455/g.12735 Transcript_9455/m.12735 type:complete len:152 (-) Transcript_9455:141-596(-)